MLTVHCFVPPSAIGILGDKFNVVSLPVPLT